MSIKIGHASIDENGKISGGTIGDQTGKEVFTRSWYNKPWNVYIECTDPAMAEEAARHMEDACANVNIGYDQSQRNTAYYSAVENGGSFKNAKGETDCSQLVTSCYILAGLKVSPSLSTRTIKEAFRATGKFIIYEGSKNKKYLESDAYAKRGSLHLKENGHVIMNLENGSKATASTGTSKKDIVKEGQMWANKFTGSNLELDGKRGPLTKKAGIKVLQVAMNKDYNAGLDVDGSFGPKTKAALGTHYVKRNERQYMVTAAEILLMLNGYDPNGVEMPGNFGGGMERATNAYKKDKGMVANGIVDADTFKALIS